MNTLPHFAQNDKGFPSTITDESIANHTVLSDINDNLSTQKKYYVYTLSDPRNNAIRYVGISKNPKNRWYGHNQCKDGCNEEKNNWIRELKRLHLKTKLTIIETVDGDMKQAWPREKYWIDCYTSHGEPLTNKPNAFEAFFKGYGTDEWNIKYRRGVRHPMGGEE